MKKLLAMLLCLCMVFVFAACGDTNTDTDKDADKDEAKVLSIDEVELTVADKIDAVKKEDLKVGFIFLHDKNSTYDKNFIDAANAACEALGIKEDQVIMKTGIPEGEECYTTAKELVNAGCQVIFADSFGHEPYLIKAAKEFPKVQFCHATGVRGKTEGLGNYHTAFAEIYKGRYLAGIAAGMKLNEMIDKGDFKAEEAKMGYVGAFPYAEVISGYTSFYLGAKSVCPTVTMEVQYTQSWFDIEKENTAAKALIANGCKLISQHADSSGAPSACEDAKVPNIAYNVDTSNIGPTTAIISSKISWVPYMKMMINAMLEGTSIPADYCATLAEDAVQLTALTANAAEGTQKAIDDAKAKLADGSLKVFDTKNFTVGGKELTTYLADVVDMGDFVPDTEAIVDGRFIESEKRSAPYFNVIIDGITVPES